MNWKDYDEGSAAWAPRAVGGKYEIRRSQGYVTGHGDLGPYSFQVRHTVHSGRGQWNERCLVVSGKGGWASLAEAKVTRGRGQKRRRKI